MPDLYLLDTNILVHLVRGDHAGEEIKAKYAPYTKDPKPLICAVTDGELRSLSLLFSWGPYRNPFAKSHDAEPNEKCAERENFVIGNTEHCYR
jgi:predicted nucleic acid-binding protein